MHHHTVAVHVSCNSDKAMAFWRHIWFALFIYTEIVKFINIWNALFERFRLYFRISCFALFLKYDAYRKMCIFGKLSEVQHIRNARVWFDEKQAMVVDKIRFDRVICVIFHHLSLTYSNYGFEIELSNWDSRSLAQCPKTPTVVQRGSLYLWGYTLIKCINKQCTNLYIY